jgi:hypothetical protein
MAFQRVRPLRTWRNDCAIRDTYQGVSRQTSPLYRAFPRERERERERKRTRASQRRILLAESSLSLAIDLSRDAKQTQVCCSPWQHSVRRNVRLADARRDGKERKFAKFRSLCPSAPPPRPPSPLFLKVSSEIENDRKRNVRRCCCSASSATGLDQESKLSASLSLSRSFISIEGHRRIADPEYARSPGNGRQR